MVVFEIAANKYLCVYKYGNICLTGYSDTETAALFAGNKAIFLKTSSNSNRVTNLKLKQDQIQSTIQV